jgi:hemerythrin
MATMQWDNSLCVGVREMDEQHEHLTDVINSLYYAYMDGRQRDYLGEIIRQVNDYADYHFRAEEALMERLGGAYEEEARHKAQHVEFFSRVINFLFDYLDGQQDITPELLDYLTDWWLGHIRGMDARLAEQLKSAGVC